MLHFLFMYALKLNLENLLAHARRMDIPEGYVVSTLSGVPSLATDFELDLHNLADRVRTKSRSSGGREGGRGPDSCSESEVQEFLRKHGDRFLRGQDISSPTLDEDPRALEVLLDDVEAEAYSISTKPAPLPRQEVKSAGSEPPTRELALDGVARTAQSTVLGDAWEQNVNANFVWWSEDHNPVIEWRAGVPLRRACLAAARVLEFEAEDVFYLFWPELMAALDRNLTLAELRLVVSDRRAVHLEMIRRRHAVGPVLTVTRPRTWHGIPGGGGLVEGVVAAVDSLADAEQMRPGQVLVIEGATPAWSIVLNRAAAVVTATGGPLSHTAIMCRERSVPCVLSVGVELLSFVSAGDWVRVDGSSGEVTVFPDLRRG